MLIRDEMLFDKRIIKRNLKAGRISKSEYDKRMRSLKDLTSESEVMDAGITHIDHDIPAVKDNDEDEL